MANGAIPSGPLLLKLIISQAHVDSRATVTFIRNSLRKLGIKMIELDSNVIEFNLFVKAQIKALAHRGETTSDLLINLFEGYEAANDVEFADLIRRKKNDYEEGKDVTVTNLMADMVAKCRTRIMNNNWSAPTKEQEQILALTARVEELKKSTKPPSKQLKPAGPAAKKKKATNKWAWKDTLPKDSEPTAKEFEGKQHHVNCPWHKEKWVCHTPEECLKNPANAPTGGRPATNNRSTTPGSRRLQAAQLAVALLEEGEVDEEDEQEEDL